MKNKSKSYAVFFEDDDPIGKGCACYAAIAVCAMLALAELVSDANLRAIDTKITLGVLALIAAFSFLQSRHLKKPAARIIVCANSFHVERGEKRGQEYAFSQITRVSLHFPLVPGSKGGVRQGKPFWRIYVGRENIASFTMEMKNADRLLAKLDALGLITPLGTGVRAERK